jgi:hypothetical protein
MSLIAALNSAVQSNSMLNEPSAGRLAATGADVVSADRRAVATFYGKVSVFFFNALPDSRPTVFEIVEYQRIMVRSLRATDPTWVR